MDKLGSRSRVSLRTVWPNEASDFTPWIQENISVLGEALGLELEVEAREAPVGDFSLDLLVREVERDRKVVIENQLTDTDHGHLGQLITYAAGFDAKVVIWLARDFRDEHRQALDWLNQRTDEETEFFGVLAELLRIDDSRPAINFRPVAFPNGWSKSVRSKPSNRQLRYREYFQRLIDELRNEHGFRGTKNALFRSICGFPTGFKGIRYNTRFLGEDRIRVNLHIGLDDPDENESVFDGLFEERSDIESEFGEALVWERLEGRPDCIISKYRDGSIDEDEEMLNEIRAWSVSGLANFKKTFGPRLAGIVGE